MSESPNSWYGEYLEHSVRYYLLDNPVVNDAYFDDLCRRLLSCWGDVTHKLKHLCDESALVAGSGSQLSGPEIEPIVWLCSVYPDRP